MLKKTAVFESFSIPKAVATLAVPTILSMVVTVVYNMVDTFFVGFTNDPNQVAAVSLATPVFLFLMAAGNIFGVGGSAYISRSLGEKKFDRVRGISSFCLYAGIATGLVMGLFYIFGMPLILNLCGASKNTAGFAKDYLSCIAWGAPFVVVSGAFSNLIRGEGASKTAMTGMMIGTIVNIILDPLFILYLNKGVAGAAIATVIGNICSCAFFLIYVARPRSAMTISPAAFKVRDGILFNVFAIGLPASLNNVLMSLSNIVLNNFLAQYGDIPVAAMGIAMKANMLVIFLQLGLGIGVQPLIGYNYGAKNFTRMKAVIKFSIFCNLVSGTVLTIVYSIFSWQIVNAFIANRDVITIGVRMLRALMLSTPVLGIMFIINFAFQGMGRALPSLILSISRQGFIFLPCLFIGRAIAGLNGLIYAQAIADLFSIVIAIIMFLHITRTLERSELR